MKAGIFLVGRRAHDEDQLTEMIAWLATTVPAVGRSLMELAGSAQDSVDDIDLRTQVVVDGGRLDALITSSTTALVVESKLKSGFGESQLRRYIDWLADKHSDRELRSLMTLTRSPAQWPAEDLEHAVRRRVTPVARRWEELYELLESRGDDSTDLESQLISEFLDMLVAEGLVPMQPLREAEFGDRWSMSRAVVVRYHEFFRACKSAIAEALDAEIVPNQSSEHFEYTWQGFRIAEGERLVVGVWYTDEGAPVRPATYKHAPIVWMAADAREWVNWDTAARWLEEHPPEGWRHHIKRWQGRPQVWCYLQDAIGADASFDEQRAKLSHLCALGKAWIDSARRVD